MRTEKEGKGASFMEASGSKVLQSSWFQCQELEWKATNSEKTTLEIKVFRVFNCDTHSWGWGVPLGCGTPRSGFPSAIWCFYVHQRQVQRGTERLNQTGFVWLPHLIIKSPGRNNNYLQGLNRQVHQPVQGVTAFMLQTHTCVPAVLFLKTNSQCFAFHAFKCKCWKSREH